MTKVFVLKTVCNGLYGHMCFLCWKYIRISHLTIPHVPLLCILKIFYLFIYNLGKEDGEPVHAGTLLKCLQCQTCRSKEPNPVLLHLLPPPVCINRKPKSWAITADHQESAFAATLESEASVGSEPKPTERESGVFLLLSSCFTCCVTLGAFDGFLGMLVLTRCRESFKW